MIEYKSVCFSFDKRFELANINLNFEKGTLYGLCGKNGSGKTTLMFLLLGIYSNYTGEIFINNVNQRQYNLKKLRSDTIQYIEQTPVFFDEPISINFGLFEGEKLPIVQVKKYVDISCFDVRHRCLPPQRVRRSAWRQRPCARFCDCIRRWRA